MQLVGLIEINNDNSELVDKRYFNVLFLQNYMGIKTASSNNAKDSSNCNN